jgi:uncharacterized membrane protein
LAIVLAALTAAYVPIRLYPPRDLLFGPAPGGLPFADARGATLLYLLGATALACLMLRSSPARRALAGAGYVLLLYVLPFELGGLGLITGYAATAVLAMATARLLAPSRALHDTAPLGSLLVPWAGAAGLSVLVALARYIVLPTYSLTSPLPRLPFTDEATTAAAMLIAAGTASTWLRGGPAGRRAALLWTTGVLAVLLTRETTPLGMAIGWALLSAPLIVLGQRDQAGRDVYLFGAVVLQLLAFITMLSFAEPHSLRIDGLERSFGGSRALLATAVQAAVLALGARVWRKRWPAMVAGAVLMYGLSVALVDVFALRVARGAPLVATANQAQVALSIVWAALGGAAFVAGVMRWGRPWRAFGLALLALATAKVFLVDLQALDAAYKVPSFIGLGILLLLSSFIYQRSRREGSNLL